MKASDLFIKALENEGVEYIFGLPGEENLDILESIRTSDKIKFVLTRHEQGAGFMAATYGRLTGKPGVCLSTLGPGATNLVTTAAYGQLGAMPMVMITGQKPIKSSKQGKFQIIDVVEMMQPLTKYTKQITYGEHIPAIIREAFRVSGEERPGAVHIELPEDVAQEDVTDPKIFDVVDYKIPYAGKAVINHAANMVRNAKMPLLLIGAGANRKRASKALTHFVNSLQIPFFNTQMGKGIIDERNPLYLGTAALSDDDFLHEAIHKADLIINVGHDTIEKPPFIMENSSNQNVIHVNYFAAEIDQLYFPHYNVIGDIAGSVKNLAEALKPDAKSWDNEVFFKVRDNVSAHLMKYEDDDRFPILPQRLVKLVRHALPDDGIVTLDNGIYKIWFARNYPAYVQNSLILDNALATMGAGLPSAIMAKELYPDKKVISINGDGGFMMNSQELETAVRLQLDLVVIILNDNAYGMIQWKQEGEGFPKYGLDYKNPDFVKYAESFGATGYQPKSVKEFTSNLEEALTAKGVQVIDLAVDYSLNHEILNVILKEFSKNIK
ncbi:acetolactate synthase large subunit [Algibacter amylolyticus]|uniref:Acetolactate synthase large subunit n=1 Tax=Algibacter amylolyticus TaxID=1608400 RepID=A0A5M7BAB7_9FLAO|nr:acetolactate synthase large subunit [Algibacter amylolyticus]KAA5825660.1 acetolactate synthase large subunit [Algibacter amylolyticus]MBB5268110.1 acetolactate synthase-1/2/3 large subunit [Algibacter amylolyticus]TSJ79958.1 acetolactate synthase large subunit [Algibacter amylolyticus]